MASKNNNTEKELKFSSHGDRDDLAGEHPFGDSGQLVILIIFLIIWIIDSFIVKFSIFLQAYIPKYVNLFIGLFIIGLAFYIATIGLKTVFGEKRDPPKVIDSGLFSYCRHPIYLSVMLIYLGLFITTLSLISLIMCVIAFLFYHYITLYEEKLVEQKFGNEYLEYKKRVPMWIPKLKIRTEKSD